MSAATGQSVASSPPPGSPIPGVFGLLLRLMASQWRHGRLTVVMPDDARWILAGEPSDGGTPQAELKIHDPAFARRVLKSGDIGFAEAYMAQEWDTPDLAGLLSVLAANHAGIKRLFDGNILVRGLNWIGHRLNRNDRSGAQRNIHAHYDLGNAFYAAWLDRTMTYSSARFASAGDEPLETAQTRKYESLARAMRLEAGHHVLEIGCGWGGFAEYAAGTVGARVTGITVSRAQYDFAQARLAQAGLAERAEIRLVDYRDIEGRFDRVASIEMFEAVGQEYWPAYFGKIAAVLKPGGCAGLQIITIDDALFAGYRKRADFIQKYIFPGGMLPGETTLKPVIAQAGLAWEQVERFGQDYARTLAAWDRRFQAAWPDIAAMDGFDERFRRLWRFYLAYCEAGFRTGRTDVIQLVLGRN